MLQVWGLSDKIQESMFTNRVDGHTQKHKLTKKLSLSDSIASVASTSDITEQKLKRSQEHTKRRDWRVGRKSKR